MPGSYFYNPIPAFFNATTGAAANTYTLTFYEAGTTTLQAIYSDFELTTPLANPLSCDQNGRPNDSQSVFLTKSLPYKVVLKNPSGVEQWAADNIIVGEDSYPELAWESSYIKSSGYPYWHAFRYIDSTYHAGILDGTNTVDLATELQNVLEASSAGGETLRFPAGYYQTEQAMRPRNGGSIWASPQSHFYNISTNAGSIKSQVIRAGNCNSVDLYPIWEAETTAATYERVWNPNGTAQYVCITGGTTDTAISGGPTGTGDVLDGTVTWRHVRTTDQAASYPTNPFGTADLKQTNFTDYSTVTNQPAARYEITPNTKGDRVMSFITGSDSDNFAVGEMVCLWDDSFAPDAVGGDPNDSFLNPLNAEFNQVVAVASGTVTLRYSTVYAYSPCHIRRLENDEGPIDRDSDQLYCLNNFRWEGGRMQNNYNGATGNWGIVMQGCTFHCSFIFDEIVDCHNGFEGNCYSKTHFEVRHGFQYGDSCFEMAYHCHDITAKFKAHQKSPLTHSSGFGATISSTSRNVNLDIELDHYLDSTGLAVAGAGYGHEVRARISAPNATGASRGALFGSNSAAYSSQFLSVPYLDVHVGASTVYAIDMQLKGAQPQDWHFGTIRTYGEATTGDVRIFGAGRGVTIDNPICDGELVVDTGNSASIGDVVVRGGRCASGVRLPDFIDTTAVNTGANAGEAITGAVATPTVELTVTGTSRVNGETVHIGGITAGMVEINNRSFTVANVTANTFELSGEDGTGHTAWNAGDDATAKAMVDSTTDFMEYVVKDGTIPAAAGAYLQIEAHCRVLTLADASGPVTLRATVDDGVNPEITIATIALAAGHGVGDYLAFRGDIPIQNGSSTRPYMILDSDGTLSSSRQSLGTGSIDWANDVTVTYQIIIGGEDVVRMESQAVFGTSPQLKII